MKIKIIGIPPNDEFAFKIPSPEAPEDIRKGFVGQVFEVWETEKGAGNAVNACTKYPLEEVCAKAYLISTSEMNKVFGATSETVKWYSSHRPAINAVMLIDKKACEVVN